MADENREHTWDLMAALLVYGAVASAVACAIASVCGCAYDCWQAVQQRRRYGQLWPAAQAS